MKKGAKIILIVLISILVLFSLIAGYIYIANDNKIAILGYHGVLPKKENTEDNGMIIDSEKFEEQIKLLKKMGYKSLTLKDLYCWKNKQCKKSHKSVLITFDDGYYNNYKYAFAILKKYNMNGVVFAIGNYVKNGDNKQYFNMDTIKKIEEEYPNIEVASHSYDLHYSSEKTYAEVNNDIKKMDELYKTRYYAYPFGAYNDEYVKALKDNDFKLAFTFGPGKEHRKADIKDDNLKMPRLNISKEMPNWKFILRLLLPM